MNMAMEFPLELLERVRTVIDEALGLQGQAQHFDRGTRLFGELPEFDSMAVVNLVAGLEQEFDIVIDDDEVCAEIFTTVESLLSFVAHKREPRGVL